jgi:hypothetical protein
VQTGNGVATYSLTLHKGARDREAEEAVLDGVILNGLADAVGIEHRVPLSLLQDEIVSVESATADLLGALLKNDLRAVHVQLDGQIRPPGPLPAAILAGSFNPIHEAHWRLADVATTITRGTTAFELSVSNVDKPALATEQIRQRLYQFTWRSAVWVTRAATFREKASLFPGSVFVLGADTVERLVAPRYYQNSDSRMAEAFEHIRRQGCRFLVAGRRDSSGKFIGLADMSLPADQRDLFTAIPQAEFDVPVSSTALRESSTVTLTDDIE